MNKREKKQRKLRSIEIMNKQKFEEWERDDVYKDISIYEWVEFMLKLSFIHTQLVYSTHCIHPTIFSTL